MKFLKDNGFNAIRFLFNHETVLQGLTLEPPNEKKYGKGAPWEVRKNGKGSGRRRENSRRFLARCLLLVALPKDPRHTSTTPRPSPPVSRHRLSSRSPLAPHSLDRSPALALLSHQAPELERFKYVDQFLKLAEVTRGPCFTF